jgi:hypothetical protein
VGIIETAGYFERNTIAFEVLTHVVDMSKISSSPDGELRLSKGGISQNGS